MRRGLRALALAAVATTSCALAFLLADFLVSDAPRLLLALLTEVEFHEFRVRRLLPEFQTRFPDEGSALLHALYSGGFLFSGMLSLALGALATARAKGWARLFAAHATLWIATLLALYTGVFVVWSAGPLSRALSILWPEQAAGLTARVLAGVAVGAIVFGSAYWSLRCMSDSLAESRTARLAGMGLWLLLPFVVVTLVLTTALLSGWSLLRWGVTLAVVALLLLTGLPAALVRAQPAPAFAPGRKGAFALLFLFGLTLASLHSYPALRAWAQQSTFSRLASTHVRLYLDPAALEQVDAQALAAKLDERVAGMAARMGLEPPNPPLRVYLYASTDKLRTMVGSDEPFTVDSQRRAVHQLLAPDGSLSDPRGEALLLTLQRWGLPASENVARALARFAVGTFYGYPLADYARRIAREERAYTLKEVLETDDTYLSPLVRDALGGAWVERLVAQRGTAVLATLYQAPLQPGEEESFAATLGTSWAQLEDDWKGFLLEATEGPVPADTPPSPGTAAYFHRGISFSHDFPEGLGYGSDQALRELAKIRALGANSIAIVPYAFTRAPREVSIFFNTDETDARVIRTIQAAERLGLHVMLKPQLWGPGFTGDIAFADDARFVHWFDLYSRWLRHFARLAELQQVDLLVIGTELAGLTPREADWRALIRDVRRIYSGPLTYAAHWGPEFETLPFWDALDLLGLNMYYPLAAAGETARVESPEIKELTQKLAEMTRKHRKPILFTEVGYPSITSAATEPWKERAGALSLEAQQRCYQVVFEAFYHQPWLAGLYWWKWPSHGRGGRYDPSFTPLGKPALEVVAEWYGPEKARSDFESHLEGDILIKETGGVR